MSSDLNRRALLAGSTAVAAVALLPGLASAQSFGPERHGLSTFGELKHAADTPHFPYVNPVAPKGGSFSQELTRLLGNQNFDTFNTLHIYVLRGDGAGGIELTFDSLMARALDEPDALYGLVARSVAISEDGLTYRFRLRPEARFHDGSRLTARDAAFSIMVLKDRGHPRISQDLRLVEAAKAEDDETLLVTFAKDRARTLPQLVASLPIFSERFWTGKDFEAGTLDPVLGSGPYKVGRFEAGRYIELDRVADYWARDLAPNVGLHNFDRLRWDYFRDDEAGFQAFTSGTFTFREEFTARIWATRYDFPALKDGRVKRETIPDETPSGAQGWYFNTRRPQLRDPRIREAINLAFDFKWTNGTVMYGAYERTVSYFQGSDMMANGPPSPAELALLEPFRDKLPKHVFGEPVPPPVSDGSGQDRALLRRASQLLNEAGCKLNGRTLLRPDGQPFTLEFLDFTDRLQPHTNPFIRNLGLLGIQANYRTVDPAQYQRRTDDYDFDITSRRYSLSSTPGEGMRNLFGSRAAGTPGAQNLAGIADPVVDALIEVAVSAETREDLVTACRALDRVLRAGHYWVPMWHKGSHTIAYWDVFGKPAEKPRYDRGAPLTWWYDAEKAKRIGR